MTTSFDSLLADFGRHTDRHLESARLKIAPEIVKAPKAPGALSPEPSMTPAAEVRKDVK